MQENSWRIFNKACSHVPMGRKVNITEIRKIGDNRWKRGKTICEHSKIVLKFKMSSYDSVSPMVFQWAGSVRRPMRSTGGVASVKLICTPVLLSFSGLVKKEFGKGSAQYSGTRGSHGPRLWTVMNDMHRDNIITQKAAVMAPRVRCKLSSWRPLPINLLLMNRVHVTTFT